MTIVTITRHILLYTDDDDDDNDNDNDNDNDDDNDNDEDGDDDDDDDDYLYTRDILLHLLLNRREHCSVVDVSSCILGVMVITDHES